MRLRDGALHEALEQRRSHQEIDAAAPARFAPDRDLIGVAAKLRDVIPDPPDPRELIERSVVSSGVVIRLPGQFGMDEPPEHVQPVSHAHHHYSLLSDGIAIIDGLGRGPVYASTAVDPDQHGKFLRSRSCRSPHVQIQAVFTRIDESPVPRAAVWRILPLHAGRRKTIRRPGPLPRNHRLRGPPPQVADRWRSERNAEIFADTPTPSRRSANLPPFDVNRLLDTRQ